MEYVVNALRCDVWVVCTCIAVCIVACFIGFGRGAGTGPAGPAVAGPMFTPSLRHDDVLLALTIQYYTSAAVTGHLSNWILPLSVLLRVRLVWPA